ncbi:MAG: TonB-dependent receptor [Pseudomonadota bacterium]
MTSASAFAIAGGALAQTAEETSGQAADEIVVQGIKTFRDLDASGTGFDLPLVETPFSISVLSRELLETTNSFNAVRASNLIGGLGAVQVSGGVNTDYFARGFTLDTFTGFKQNGLSIVRNFEMDLAAVERIEFIKGPSGIEYGRANPGGVVNVVTKTPQAEQAGSVRFVAGSHEFYRVEADSTGSITDRLRYRIVGAAEQAGSFIDQVESDTTVFAPSLEYDLTDRTLVQFIGYAQRHNNVPEAGLSTNEFGEIPKATFDANRELFTGQPWAYANTYAQSLQFIIDHEFSENLTGKFNIFQTKSDFERRYARPRFIVYENDFVDLEGTAREAGSVRQYQIRRPQASETTTFGQQAELKYDFGAFGREHSIVVTGEHVKFKSDGQSWGGARTLPGFDFNVYDPDYTAGLPEVTFGGINEGEQEVFSGSFQALLRPLEVLTITGGVRYDTIEASSDNDSLEVDDVTYNVGALVNVFEDVGIVDTFNVYANYATSFFPTFGQTGQLVNGVEVPGEILDPETGEQVEVGVKTELLDGELLLTLAGFKIERANVDVDDPTFGGSFSLPAGSQESKGFEAEIVGRLTPNWRVFFAYAFLDTENTDVGPGGDPLVLGRPMANVPENSASFYTNYLFEGNFLDGLQIGGGLVYRGERAGNDFIRTDFSNEIGDEGFFDLPADTVVNLDARYQIKENIKVSLNVTNVFDELGFDSSFSWNGSGIKPIPPREVFLGLTVDW